MMDDHAGDRLLDRLKSGFAPYMKKSSEAMTSVLQREYLEAIHENAIATTEYKTAVKHSQTQGTALRQHSADDGVLAASLQLRRQQREHSLLDIIEHYRRKLTQSSHKSEHDPSTELSVDEIPTGTDNVELATKVEAAEALLKKLEYAAITAKQERDDQKHRLETARAAHSLEVSEVRQAHALTAVHVELTRWLEDSLTLCASDIPVSHIQSEETKKGRLTTADVQQAYEQYVEARSELIRVVKTPSINSQKYETQLMPAPGKQQIQPIRDILLESGNNAANAVHAAGLERLYQYSQNEVGVQQATTIDHLRRLADESQLLPAYPLLARSGRAVQVATALGRKESVTGDEVTREVEAWDFAAGAAGEVTGQALNRYVAAAYDATASAQVNLEDLRRLLDLTQS